MVTVPALADAAPKARRQALAKMTMVAMPAA
jgi:hypothetical protein